jgi:hypothetical protein
MGRGAANCWAISLRPLDDGGHLGEDLVALLHHQRALLSPARAVERLACARVAL